MFKAQYKKRSPYESWLTIGSYGSEQQAISMALNKKSAGAVLVRVTDKKGGTVYSG